MKVAAVVLLCLAATLPVGAVEADYKQVLVTPRHGSVEVRLPLTDVTGPVRVKQRAADGFGIPIAPSRSELDESCYLEWQISYDTTHTVHPSLVPGVKFQRDGRAKYGCELTKILVSAVEEGVLSREELQQLRGELDILRAVDLEAAEKIALQPDTASTSGVPREFERFVQKVPQFIASTPEGSIEIQFKPKQRAVGYQPMIYVCVPAKAWRQASGTPRPAGRARVKETITFRFGPPQHDLLLSVVRAFGIASREHNEDLTKILDAILGLQR